MAKKKLTDQQRIEQIEELLENITPGPWTIGEEGDQEVEIDARKGDKRLDMTAWDGFITVYGNFDDPEVGEDVMYANADFVAAAPDNMKFLLALAKKALAAEKGESDAGK